MKNSSKGGDLGCEWFIGSYDTFVLPNISSTKNYLTGVFLHRIEKILVAALHMFLSSQNICFCSET